MSNNNSLLRTTWNHHSNVTVAMGAMIIIASQLVWCTTPYQRLRRTRTRVISTTTGLPLPMPDPKSSEARIRNRTTATLRPKTKNGKCWNSNFQDSMANTIRNQNNSHFHSIWNRNIPPLQLESHLEYQMWAWRCRGAAVRADRCLYWCLWRVNRGASPPILRQRG